MKKIMIALVAVAMLAATAVPAFAQNIVVPVNVQAGVALNANVAPQINAAVLSPGAIQANNQATTQQAAVTQNNQQNVAVDNSTATGGGQSAATAQAAMTQAMQLISLGG